ncbi:ribosome small subunit-dependent GTPase A [Bdellovibrio sp. 22V]|uniref:ribosome small subunit-dependent GTPase A n=1 Tax=Bdellovibrio sp. 22V TaxID=3044166 RepID=UPI00254378E6|nr:ribosome small subunit-dependent GTPase A [Bdellovibrio sp. 22V]WII72092.1 ribosome small subunit-dependent GTPase A [Bdellovibrio sp. 22V]
MNLYSKLIPLGWDAFFEQQLESSTEHWQLGRVIGQERDLYRVAFAEDDVVWAQLSGRFRHDNELSAGAFPAVGDWVACKNEENQDRALIQKVLERRSCFYRKDPQEGVQVVAANMDVVFIVTSMNRDMNLKRLDRYLSMAWDSGASPVLVLSKMDLAEDPAAFIQELEETYIGVPIHGVSVLEPDTCEVLKNYLRPGKTVVLMGSSGVGKSTLTNFFLGENTIKTQNAREDDDRGRHTTTSRFLYQLREGALLMDTPGMRQLALVDQEEGLHDLFEDIIAIGSTCRFRDCAHQGEPGCSIRAALEDGSLPEDRWESYLKLQKEVAYQEARGDRQKQAEDRKKWKKISKDLRVRIKQKGRGEI